MDEDALHGRTPSMIDRAHSQGRRGKVAPDLALQWLRDGNQRFFEGQPQTNVVDAFLRRQLVVQQTPFALILGCSDSRVPVEIVFDQGLGDLFVVRVAGNVAESSALATIEFAVKYLEIAAIVVLGHEGCGAVQLAMGSWLKRQSEPRLVRDLIDSIAPAVASIPENLPEVERIRLCVESNIRRQVERLLKETSIGSAVRSGDVALAGAYYEIATGRVEFLD